jgi:predicted  nucleic acid-binding Zn-ribbon protein
VITAVATSQRDKVNQRRQDRRDAVAKAQDAATELKKAAGDLSMARLHQTAYNPAELEQQTLQVMLGFSKLRTRAIDAGTTLKTVDALQPLENATNERTTEFLNAISRAQPGSTGIEDAYSNMSTAISNLENKLTELLQKRGGQR